MAGVPPKLNVGAGLGADESLVDSAAPNNGFDAVAELPKMFEAAPPVEGGFAPKTEEDCVFCG